MPLRPASPLGLAVAMLTMGLLVLLAARPAMVGAQDDDQAGEEAEEAAEEVEQEAEQEAEEAEQEVEQQAEQTPREREQAADDQAGAEQGERFEIRQQGEGDQMPTPPSGMRDDVDTPLGVSVNAGLGSDTAYASESIVELGGSLALVHQSETTTFDLSPQVGYFIVDNIQLSLLPSFRIIHVEDSTDVGVGAVLEPSYHLPLSDRIFVFAGVGLGFEYAEDPGFEVVLRPRIGLDGLVGRSGIFKPSLFIDVGLDDGAVAGGVQAGFTVIL